MQEQITNDMADLVRSPTVVAAALLAAVNVGSYVRTTRPLQQYFGWATVARMLRAQFATQVVVPLVAVLAAIANERDRRMDPQSSLVLVVLANAAGLYYSYQEYELRASGGMMTMAPPATGKLSL